MISRTLTVLLTWLCLAPAHAGDVTVFAAASLKTALDEITEGSEVTVSYAGSSIIARQIALGAPADLVMTANAAWMDYLEVEGRLSQDTRRDLLGNELVLIAPSDMAFIALANRSVDDIVGEARIAMALVDAVPAGIYGREALDALGLWASLSAQVVQTDNVRAALRLVALGEATFGIVYATDAMAEPKVQIVHRFDPAGHTPIRYSMALVAGRERPAARAIWENLQSPRAAEIFARHGFVILDPAQ